MTVIAYTKGVMCSDSRVTEGTSVFTDKLQKIFRLKDGSLLATAGDADDSTLFGYFNKVKKPTTKGIAGLMLRFEALVVKPDGAIMAYSCEKEEEPEYWKVSMIHYQDPYIALGSGAYLAMGAMAHGATAEQAVKIAIKHDSGCGGEIQKVKLIDV